jgi:hypothetical protein
MGDCVKCKDDSPGKKPCLMCDLAKKCNDKIDQLNVRNKLLASLLAEAIKNLPDSSELKTYAAIVLNDQPKDPGAKP